jgi:hypothetical protein
MKPLVDQYISLDARQWQGLALLTPGRSHHLVWRNPPGEVVLTLMTDVSREAMTLRYCHGAGGPSWITWIADDDRRAQDVMMNNRRDRGVGMGLAPRCQGWAPGAHLRVHLTSVPETRDISCPSLWWSVSVPT